MLSKVDIIKEKILDDIKSGRIRAGETLPSRHQFMRRYTCSRGTIDEAVSSLVRAGYLYSRQGSGTFAAGIPKSETKQVFIIDNFKCTSPTESSGDAGYLASEIQRHYPCYLYGRNEVKTVLGRIAIPGSVVIWMRPGYDQLMVMNHLRDAGIPQLLIARTYSDYNYVTTDAKNGIREGLKWLISKAGRKITFISQVNNPDLPFIAERQIVFYEAAIELGIELSSDSIITMPFVDFKNDMNLLAGRLFKAKSCPPAIFLIHIPVAYPLVALAESRKKIMGRDFHILIFDDDEKLYGHPGIAMLKQRWKEMCDSALGWVINLNKNRDEEFKIRILPELIK